MYIKFNCPKCNTEITLEFETNGKMGVQQEEHICSCPTCHTKMTVALKELTARTEIYIHQHL